MSDDAALSQAYDNATGGSSAIDTGASIQPDTREQSTIRRASGMNDMIERDSNGRWLAGTSGNPKGRPPIVSGVQEIARKHSPDAIETLAAIMKDRRAPAQARCAAASAILDRAWGKPQQSLTGEDGEALVIKVIKFGELDAVTVIDEKAIDAIH